MIFRSWLLVISSLTACSLGMDGQHRLARICTEAHEDVCEIKVRGEKVTCSRSFKTLTSKEQTKAKQLTLCNWDETSLSPYYLHEKFPKVTRLSLRGGNITFFLEDFPAMPLESLAITEQRLDYLQPSVFSKLKHLKTLDLQKNLFQDLDPAVIYTLPEATRITFSGNPWDCSPALYWMLDPVIQAKVSDLDKLHCETPYPGKPLVSALKFLQKMGDECPINCKCTMSHLTWDMERTYLHPVIEVNCSNKKLQEIPRVLPSNTTTLYLNNNEIADISPLVFNPIFANILDVYLNHNYINSIDVLEGSNWLKNFRILSLENNLLPKLTLYALDHAFETNKNLGKMYLAGNPWICNCEFTPGFQHFLVKYRAVVRDAHNIKCADTQDDDLALMPILELSRNSICYNDDDYAAVNPLDILSIVLAGLILLLLGKLAYDYWAFRRTGKLPWIVAKMP